jgi:cardiolipin synthase
MLFTLLLMLLTGIVTAAYFIFGLKRRDLHVGLDPDAIPPIEQALPLFAGLTNAEIHHENSVTVFQNEDLLNALLGAIAEAQYSIHFETYVWEAGVLEKQFVELLSKKAQEGVHIRLLVDAMGAMKADDGALKSLEEHGVEVAQYRKISLMNIRRFNNRSHRKLLIVDGCIGFIFGHGVADEWFGHGDKKNYWRDTGVRIDGNAVRSLQSIFVQDWMDARREVPTDDSCFPAIQGKGSAKIHVVSSTGDLKSSVALLYKLAIASARREVIIQNPYFTPDPVVPQLLKTVAERGVTVHLMVPGEHTDSRLVRRAGFYLYETMLSSGVRLYEYKPTLLHQKIVIIDGQWSHVGSTNFDERSLAMNAEIGVGILDRSVAHQLTEAFHLDLTRSKELTLGSWSRRPWYERVLDWCAYQLHGQI